MTSRKFFRRALVLAGVCSVILVVGAQMAFAKATPPDVGRAVFFADEGCFSLNFSAVTNNCATQKAYEMPLVVDNMGAQTVYISAFAPTSANTVGCNAVGTDFNATTAFRSPTVFLSSFGTPQTLTLVGAFVPSFGRLYATCYLNHNGVVNTVVYNPG